MSSRQPRTQSSRSEEERDEPSLQQHAIGLIAGEVLRGTDERQETRKANDQHEAGIQIEHEQERGPESGPAQCAQHDWLAREPQQGGRVPNPLEVAEALCHCLQVVDGWQDSLGTDEAADLKEQREKCRKVNSAECPKKQPTRNQAVRTCFLPIEEPGDRGRSAAIHDRCNYTEKETSDLDYESLTRGPPVACSTPVLRCKGEDSRHF